MKTGYYIIDVSDISTFDAFFVIEPEIIRRIRKPDNQSFRTELELFQFISEINFESRKSGRRDLVWGIHILSNNEVILFNDRNRDLDKKINF